MDYTTSLEMQRKAFNFLDTKDLMKLILPHRSIYDIAYEIGKTYDDEYTEDESVLNWIDHEELMDYLQKRYNITFYESIDFLVGTCN